MNKRIRKKKAKQQLIRAISGILPWEIKYLRILSVQEHSLP